MSTDISACVVFGVKVSEDFLWDIKPKRRCDHEFDSKFCPECGQPGELKPYKTPKAGWDQYRDTFSVLKVVKCRNEKHEIIVGCVISRASFNPCRDPISTVPAETPYHAGAIAEILGVKPEDVKTYLVMEAT